VVAIYIAIRHTSLTKGVGDMQLILTAAGAVGLIVGSLLAAALLCSFPGFAFRHVRHPEWAVSPVLILLLLRIAGQLPKSQFLDMTLTFAAVAVVPLWFARRARREHRGPAPAIPRRSDGRIRPSETVTPTDTAFSPRLYPAITACICEERAPTRDEVHMVAARLWREGFARRFGTQTVPPSFAARRLLVRAATTALSGRGTAPSLRTKM
jgi:hypothetical protein